MSSTAEGNIRWIRTRRYNVRFVESLHTAPAQVRAAPTPKTRYVVGRDAKIRMWIEKLPDRLRDRVMIGRMPKYGG